MITYSASDILREAKVLSNTSNVNFPSFSTVCNLLNSEYQKLYNDIVYANGAQIKEEEMTIKPYMIPEDCYHIIGVYKNGRLVPKSTVKQNIKGTYKIENNEIICEGPIKVKYSILPQTITSPDKPEKLDIDVKEVGLVTDYGFYYKDSDNKSLYFKFSSLSSEEMDFKTESNRFLDHELIFKNGKFTYADTDVTYIFEREDVGIKSVHVSDPYVVVNYTDDRSFIFYGFEGSDQLNWNESKGKETYGEVLGFTTNDITGKGCIWKDIYGDIYYTSFTPDTILNYPNNTFFQLLIYRLAASLANLNGTMNQYLVEELIPKAEVAFYDHLAKDNATPVRMNNNIF